MKELCDQETQLKNILEKLKKIAKNSPHNPNWPTGINCAFDHFLVLNFYGDKWNQILNKVPTNEIEIQKQNLSMRSMFALSRYFKEHNVTYEIIYNHLKDTLKFYNHEIRV